jgi:hypothetical protein
MSIQRDSNSHILAMQRIAPGILKDNVQSRAGTYNRFSNLTLEGIGSNVAYHRPPLVSVLIVSSAMYTSIQIQKMAAGIMKHSIQMGMAHPSTPTSL